MYTIGPADITAEASHMSATTKYDAQVKGKKDKDKLTTHPEALRDPILLEHEQMERKRITIIIKQL